MTTETGGSSPRFSVIERLKSLQFAVSRRLLFWWIRPTILGCSAESLALSPDDHVCYVLPFRSVSDLMVVDKACESAGLPRPVRGMRDQLEQRAFFFLGHPEGRLGRKSLRSPSTRMLRLFEHQTLLHGNIRIVPVSLFWGHQPDQEKSLFRLLFSENWAATSRFKKLLAILFHPHHILVQFAAPIDLNDMTRDQDQRELQVRKLMRILRVHFTHQKQAILGPDLSHRRTLIASIMASQDVIDAINKEASARKTSTSPIEKKALGYANEIASDQSYRVIRFFHLLLTWLWNKLYKGIEVHNIDKVKELARSSEIVYTPCHRSHIDYLLLSYVLYHNGLTPPHIAAGINLNLPIAGPLLRRAGAFFMRRSFSGDRLYKAVFDEYLHLMFTRGYSVEYFIEGGRSRTGRILSPRTGMLSMTMRSFQRDASRPLVLMPVYFGYERVIEASTYMGELAGREKKQESIFDIFKIFSVFKHAFGKVAVNFGEPVPMEQFLDSQLPGWTEPSTIPPPAFSDACVSLSHRLAANINGAAVVNPVNLVATALLSTTRQTIEKNRLLHQLNLLRNLTVQVPGYAETIVTAMDPEAMIVEAELIAGITHVKQPFGDIFVSPPALTVLLTWYRNNTVHLFSLPSLIARIVRSREDISDSLLIDACMLLYPYLRSEMFLKWHTVEVADICRFYIDRMTSLGILTNDQGCISTPAPASEAYAALSDIGEIIEPTLERFFLVTSLLSQGGDMTIKRIETDAAAIARQLSAIFSINSPEFFDRSLFSTFIGALRSQCAIETRDESVLLNDDVFARIHRASEVTLSPDIRYNVLQAIERRARLAVSSQAE